MDGVTVMGGSSGEGKENERIRGEKAKIKGYGNLMY